MVVQYLRVISSAPGLGIVMLCVGCAGYILCTHRGIMPDVLNDQDSWRRAYEHSPNDTRNRQQGRTRLARHTITGDSHRSKPCG
jgi:hypothetical protein